MPLLTGVRIMITRAAEQADSLYRGLADLGAEVLVYPAIATRAYTDADGWRKLRNVTTADAWLIFTSENGVRYFFEQFPDQCPETPNPGRFKVAVVGGSTAETLKSFDMTPQFVPAKATGEDFAREFAAGIELRGATVVRVRGNLADETVDSSLVAAGATVIPLTVYETFYQTWTQDMKDNLLMAPPDAVIFASGSSVDGLYVNLTADEANRTLAPVLLVSIGPSTSAAMRRRGLTVGLEAKRHTIPDLIEELAAYAKENTIRRKQ